MKECILLFVLGFSCITSVYEISKTSKSNRSEKVRKSVEKYVGKK